MNEHKQQLKRYLFLAEKDDLDAWVREINESLKDVPPIFVADNGDEVYMPE